jgi:hypothetical protein
MNMTVRFVVHLCSKGDRQERRADECANKCAGGLGLSRRRRALDQLPPAQERPLALRLRACRARRVPEALSRQHVRRAAQLELRRERRSSRVEHVELVPARGGVEEDPPLLVELRLVVNLDEVRLARARVLDLLEAVAEAVERHGAVPEELKGPVHETGDALDASWLGAWSDADQCEREDWYCG